MSKKTNEKKMSNEAGTIYADITVGNRIVRVSKAEYQGKVGLDIRTYYDRSQGPDEDWAPTPKGVRIPEESLKDFFNGIAKAKRLMQV